MQMQVRLGMVALMTLPSMLSAVTKALGDMRGIGAGARSGI